MLLQGQPITTDFYLLSLGGCDVVLGAHWLRTLGPILLDFSNRSMQFNLDEEPCKLHGESASDLAVIGEDKIKKTIKSENRGVLQLFNIVRTPPQPKMDLLIQRLLKGVQ